jgi:hypothetical protein
MYALACNEEWLEAANRKGRNRKDYVAEPPKLELLERETRKGCPLCTEKKLGMGLQ